LYDVSTIQVLSFPEAVRRRPGMYLGGTDATARHHLLWEVVGNAVDEHLAGHASYVRVTIAGDAIAVDDDGRGIPAEAIEVVLTRMHAGSGFRRDHVHLARSQRGVGIAPVNALCEALTAEVWRDGRWVRQRFARGVPLGPVEDLGPADRTGTRIMLVPDRTIFAPAAWNRLAVARRLRELAALVPITTILDHDAFRCPDGLADHARYLARGELAPLRVRGQRDGIAVEAAVGWTADDRARVRGFVGCAPASRGTHLDGLADGLAAAIASAAPARLAGVHRAALREVLERGLVACVHVMFADPRFGEPTRERLVNPEVRAAVAAVVGDGIAAQLAADRTLAGCLLARLPG